MLTIGDKVPDFELFNQDKELVRLTNFRGKHLVLFSFPLAGSPDCTAQACSYRDLYSDFEKYNTAILGISGNPVGVLRRWHQHNRLPFDTLSDNQHILLDELGAWGTPFIGGLSVPIAKRSYWVIDGQGIIRQAQIEVDFDKSVYDSLEFIQQLA